MHKLSVNKCAKKWTVNQCCVRGVYNLLGTCYILSAIFTTLVYNNTQAFNV